MPLFFPPHPVKWPITTMSKPVAPSSQSRICPSPRPFGVFAAEGLDQELARLGANWRRPHRQPALALTDTDNMFGALEFSDKMAGYGIQPIVGCELAVDFGEIRILNARNAMAATPSRISFCSRRANAATRSLMAHLNSRAFLETPVHQTPHYQARLADRPCRGPDRIDRRSGRDRSRLALACADQSALATSRCERLGHLFGDRLYVETTAPQRRQGAARRIGVDRPRLRQGLAAGGNQRTIFCNIDDYEAHDALLRYRRWPVDCRKPSGRAVDAGPSLQDPRRDGGALRRYSGSVEFDGRDCRALRISSEDAQADPVPKSFTVGAGDQCRGCSQGGGGRAAPSGRRRLKPPACRAWIVARSH